MSIGLMSIGLMSIGLMSRRTYEPSDLWAVGLMRRRTYESSDLWAVGLMRRRSCEMDPFINVIREISFRSNLSRGVVVRQEVASYSGTYVELINDVASRTDGLETNSVTSSIKYIRHETKEYYWEIRISSQTVYNWDLNYHLYFFCYR